MQSVSVARGMSVSDASFFNERVAAGARRAARRGIVDRRGIWRRRAGLLPTMGAGLVSGRDFSDRDREGAPPVVIVNDTLARRLWPGGIPLGQLLWIAGERTGREVIGVARDRPTRDGPRPFLYDRRSSGIRGPAPCTCSSSGPRAAPSPSSLYAARGGGPGRKSPAVQSADIGQRHRRQPLLRAPRRRVVGGSGLFALLLATVGLYGVASYWVAAHEGVRIRVAIGASASDVLLLVVGQGMKLALVWRGVGLVAALALNHAGRACSTACAAGSGGARRRVAAPGGDRHSSPATCRPDRRRGWIR